MHRMNKETKNNISNNRKQIRKEQQLTLYTNGHYTNTIGMERNRKLEWSEERLRRKPEELKNCREELS